MFEANTYPIFRSTIRTLLVCSLLLIIHILLVTMAVTPSGKLAEYAELPQAIMMSSAMAILTLLWNIFLPLELTHLIKPDRRASSTHIVSHPDMMVEGEMNGRGTTGLIHPFTATLIEIITGNIAIIGWIFCFPSASIVLRSFSATGGKELVLLPHAFIFAFASLVLSQVHLVLQTYFTWNSSKIVHFQDSKDRTLASQETLLEKV